MSETIFAVATGLGKSAIAIVRISGPASASILQSLCGSCPSPRYATLRPLGAGCELIDHALVLWFPAPASFTGEDCAELHVHGSKSVLAALVKALSQFPAVRPAEPGEFARRAFDNGKMDLAAVEGLADLIDSETEGQRRQALRQLGGELGRQSETWRSRLIACLALVEAELDFSDESDVEMFDAAGLLKEVDLLQRELGGALAGSAAGERLREGFVVVLAGPPNAGKSSLLNALARREAAIVSPIPGTTRDPVEVHLELDGFPLAVIDTAGIRESGDLIEQEGVRRSLARAARADLVLWISSDAAPVDPSLTGPKILRVISKCDLATQGSMLNTGLTAISVISGAGLTELIEQLRDEAANMMAGGEAALIVRERHRQLVSAAKLSLEAALEQLDRPAVEIELVAEELRAAALSLGRITGRIDVEDVLGEIFSRFCIGK